jgi:hypothetical protein
LEYNHQKQSSKLKKAITTPCINTLVMTNGVQFTLAFPVAKQINNIPIDAQKSW